MTNAKQARIIKADKKLQSKVGFGDISDIAVIRAETVIQNNEVDFKEVAAPILLRLRDLIAQAKDTPDQLDLIRSELIKPIMELKANGGMFKYDLVGKLAGIMLSFLEHISEFNSDALEIINAHEKTLSLIIAKTMNGNGGDLGKTLITELEGACDRYYRKNPEKFLSN